MGSAEPSNRSDRPMALLWVYAGEPVLAIPWSCAAVLW